MDFTPGEKSPKFFSLGIAIEKTTTRVVTGLGHLGVLAFQLAGVAAIIAVFSLAVLSMITYLSTNGVVDAQPLLDLVRTSTDSYFELVKWSISWFNLLFGSMAVLVLAWAIGD